MKLEVGMYVRTKNGFIDKVTIDYKGYCNNPDCNCKHVSCEHNYYDEENIIKSSENIIDLIEVGDYVNGYKVTYVYPNLIKVDSADIWEIHTQDIKSIVTKEQFESMKYEVKE